MSQKLFRGSAVVIGREKTTGAKMQDLGYVDSVVFNQTEETIPYREKRTGQRNLVKEIGKGPECEVVISSSDHSSGALAIALRSSVVVAPGAAFTGVELAESTTVVTGDIYALPHADATSLVITDSTGSPVTLVLGTHYEFVSDAKASIRILSAAGLTGPLEAAGTSKPSETINALSESRKTYQLQVESVNSAEDDQIGTLTFELSFNPASQLSVITDEYGNYEIRGKATAVDGAMFVFKRNTA